MSALPKSISTPDDLLLSGYTPADLGFDARMFERYRRVQLEAMEEVVYGEGSGVRFVGLGIPTGGGKSLIAASVHRLTGLRTVVLTSTKGLQASYEKNFKHVGLVDVKGKANYECVDGGDCKVGMRNGCPCAGGSECGVGTYGEARGRAVESPLVSTNYDYWMAVHKYGQGIQRTEKVAAVKGANPVELLILDEADLAAGKLSDFLHVRVNEKEVAQVYDVAEVGDTLAQWRKVAGSLRVECLKEMETLVQERELMKAQRKVREASELDGQIERLEQTRDKFETIVGMEDGEWVIERHESPRYGVHWTFDVLWPGRYAERYLLCGVEKVVLMSATLRPKHMSQLGIGKDVSYFREWRRIFQPSRGPILHLPPTKVVEDKDGPKEVMVNLNHRIADADLRLWVEVIDRWMDEWAVRGKYKGLIHTVSYDRQAYLMEHSRHTRLMIGNTKDPESDSAWEAYERHCKAAGVSVLVSPSFGTGWDFDGDKARWQIIAKVPFVPRVGKLMQARLKIDPTYADQRTMTDLMQASGRIVRGEEDWGVTAIVDGALSFFMMRNKGLGAAWFGQAVKRVREVPEARNLGPK